MPIVLKYRLYAFRGSLASFLLDCFGSFLFFFFASFSSSDEEFASDSSLSFLDWFFLLSLDESNFTLRFSSSSLEESFTGFELFIDFSFSFKTGFFLLFKVDIGASESESDESFLSDFSGEDSELDSLFEVFLLDDFLDSLVESLWDSLLFFQ